MRRRHSHGGGNGPAAQRFPSIAIPQREIAMNKKHPDEPLMPKAQGKERLQADFRLYSGLPRARDAAAEGLEAKSPHPPCQ
jgi:hypothetical protein